MIAVNKALHSTRVDELETDCEMLWVKIDLVGSKAVYICAYYRPHESDTQSFEQFKSSLDRAVNLQNIWILGDLNFPGISWTDKSVKPGCNYPALHRDLLEVLADNGLEQTVTKPTRGNNTLDLCITNNPTRVNRCETAIGLSDHDLVFVEADLSPLTNNQSKREVPLYKKANWEGLRDHMSNHWDREKASTTVGSVNDLWESFRDALRDGINKYIPHRVAKRKDSCPWISREIRKLIKQRNRVYRKNANTGEHQERLKKLKQNVQKQVRRSYWKYIQDIILPEDTENRADNNKRFWTFIKHCKRDSVGISPLKDSKGELHTDPVGKATLLNEQFKSVFSKQTPLGPEHTDHAHRQSSYPQMPEINVCTTGVENLLKKLKPHKAAGPDQLKPLVLKEIASAIAPCLQHIFQRSLDEGIVPDDWKRANVTPIFKKGSKFQPSNYRPVSLTCICSKVMEHVIVSNLSRHLEGNHILSDRQHGFRAKRSCETQLIDFTQEIAKHLDDGQQVDAVVMDFSKAFDKVAHNRLLWKLEEYGVERRTLCWIRHFLRDRSQCVVVDGKRSDPAPVTSGVPQGSVIGPILFLVYINDLPDCVSSSIRLFADDTIIYRHIKSEADGQALQDDLRHLEDWERSWQMEFHPGKCTVLRITHKRKPIIRQYYLHNLQLETTTESKYLGVTVTSDLKWNRHIDNVTAKANRTLGFVRRNLQISSPAIKERAYMGLVRPQVEYASTVWNPYNTNLVHKVEMVQRRAARWTLNRHHNTSSVTAMLDQLQWRSLRDRRTDASLCMFYKMVTGLVTIGPLQVTQQISRPSRRTHALTYLAMMTTKDVYRYSFYPRTIFIWNSLPSAVVTAPSIETFRSRVSSLTYGNTV